MWFSSLSSIRFIYQTIWANIWYVQPAFILHFKLVYFHRILSISMLSTCYIFSSVLNVQRQYQYMTQVIVRQSSNLIPLVSASSTYIAAKWHCAAVMEWIMPSRNWYVQSHIITIFTLNSNHNLHFYYSLDNFAKSNDGLGTNFKKQTIVKLLLQPF